jgi:peptidyl-prolyl cis-trans isomerase A (cyclophilin A)
MSSWRLDSPARIVTNQPAMLPSLRSFLLVSLCAPLFACQSGKVPEPSKPAATASTPLTPVAVGGAAGSAGASAQKEKAKEKEPLRAPVFQAVSARPATVLKPTPGDPVQGKFGMEDALKGLSGKGTALYADLLTSDGKLVCELWPDKAPITVANFVGLARGLRPWKKGDSWVKEPLYDGTVFHRVIKNFMIQGGDPEGTGRGTPGFVIPDEVWENAHHDQRGLICMANRGPDTNGSQFFIMDGTSPNLDGGYTIFGKCSPADVIQKLSSTPTQGDRAISPPKISKVVVRRG